LEATAHAEPVANPFDPAGEHRLHRALRYFWHPVMYSAELGDRPQPVVLLDEQLVVRVGAELQLG
jgi:hypothetical protein